MGATTSAVEPVGTGTGAENTVATAVSQKVVENTALIGQINPSRAERLQTLRLLLAFSMMENHESESLEE